MYFTPKLSTTKVNCTGHVLCFQRPGTNLLCLYSCLFNCFSRSSFTNNPDCGRRYMPCMALMYSAVRCCLFSELIFFSDLVWDVAQFHSNEFRSVQRCHEVKIGDVHCHEVCAFLWRWHCWKAFWPPVFPQWGWQLCQDRLSYLLRQWITFDWVQPFRVVLCTQIAHTQHLTFVLMAPCVDK